MLPVDLLVDDLEGELEVFVFQVTERYVLIRTENISTKRATGSLKYLITLPDILRPVDNPLRHLPSSENTNNSTELRPVLDSGHPTGHLSALSSLITHLEIFEEVAL